MPKQKIPVQAIPRLSLYYRVLLGYKTSEFIRSSELARLTGFSAAVVRRDLAYFGQFGIPGRGYNIAQLKESILKILGIDTEWKIALVGVGNLGSALISYKGFTKHGFKIVCGFDVNPSKLNKKKADVPIKHMRDLAKYVREKAIKIAIIAVPALNCQEAVDKLVKAGVRGILNFAPFRPKAPAGIEVLNVDLSIELEKLAYFLNQAKQK
ncbi:MAG: redox-sensing transcriptional repressor Rex [Candidatus Omnitrophica bacterium]|nr:redox-sensing transcriptional repressor Rex [Candidatus Omnitrophota bacterium]MDD5236521.1 redox-sensing transcriptional repressor Rex [Candidatus Omnitrophota bacterium]MDD5610243.1 redox-sensing transcriptional repressor Rex [Candidatus Omnitrophota bacterium]